MTKAPLQAILATCEDSLRGKRDRALLLFARASGGRRRSEVTGADMRFLKPISEGFVYNLAYLKTNQPGADLPENNRPLLGVAAMALTAWLQASGITVGAIFRNVRKGGHLGEALSPAAVRAIVKERCALAGITGYFSAHSLRLGFVTEAGQQNVSLAETMALTGHHSIATVLGYSRSRSSLSGGAARLLEEK